MIPQEELTRTAERLTDALDAAAAVMPPDGGHATGNAEGASALGNAAGREGLGSPGPGGLGSSGPEGLGSPGPGGLGSPGPGGLGRPGSRPVRRGRGRGRGWLVPVGAAAAVTAIILTALTVAGHPGRAPGTAAGAGAGPAGRARAAAGAGAAAGAASVAASAAPSITSLAGVPSGPVTTTPPPAFYVSIVSMGLNRAGNELLTVQVRRTSDGQVTGTVPLSALPAGFSLEHGISVTADDRTFIVAAATTTACPSSTPTTTRFYRFDVTSTGRVTGLQPMGRLVTGDYVSEFAVSPDGTQVAYAEQGCPTGASAMVDAGVIQIMNLASGAIRSWHNTASAATPARVTSEIGALSWTGNGRTLVASYEWKVTQAPADLAVLGLDATSSGGSLQAHSRVLFSQGDHCTVCVYTAVTSADGSTLTAVAGTSAPPQKSQPGTPWHRLYVLRLSLPTGLPSGILYQSAPSLGPADDGGLVPVLSADGQTQHWILVNDPSDFGWITGGQLVPLPIKAGAGLVGIAW